MPKSMDLYIVQRRLWTVCNWVRLFGLWLAHLVGGELVAACVGGASRPPGGVPNESRRLGGVGLALLLLEARGAVLGRAGLLLAGRLVVSTFAKLLASGVLRPGVMLPGVEGTLKLRTGERTGDEYSCSGEPLLPRMRRTWQGGRTGSRGQPRVKRTGGRGRRPARNDRFFRKGGQPLMLVSSLGPESYACMRPAAAGSCSPATAIRGQGSQRV